MTDLRKAAEMALEALQYANDVCHYERCEEDFYTDEINALRQALAQPKREWVGLTEEEFESILEQHNEAFPFNVYKSIEAKLKEKNGV